MSQTEEHGQYRTIRVALDVHTDDLVAHWQFGSRSGPFAHIPMNVVRNWIRDACLWEEKTRSSGSLRSLTAEVREQATPIDRDVKAAGSAPAPAVYEDIRTYLDRTGKDIYSTLCTVDVQSFWNDVFQDWRNGCIRVLLELDRRAAERIDSIPFEALCSVDTADLVNVQDHFAAARGVSIVRKIGGVPGARRDSPPVDLPLRVLVFASNPEDLPDQEKLNIADEIKAIRDAIADSAELIQLQIVEPSKEPAPTFGTLCELGPKSHVLHFIGHGNADVGAPNHHFPHVGKARKGRLLLQDQAGRADWRDISEVTGALLNTDTQLIVLNGCHTAAVSVLACQFPAVIGMQFRISDPVATCFARGLYKQLADTGQLDDALHCARDEIRRQSPSDCRWEYRTPVLYMQSEDGILLRIKPTIRTKDLPEGRRNDRYLAQLKATGGRKPFLWRAQGLPEGLTIDTRRGIIDGVPREDGIFSVTVNVRNLDELESSKQFTLFIGGSTIRISTEQIG